RVLAVAMSGVASGAAEAMDPAPIRPSSTMTATLIPPIFRMVPPQAYPDIAGLPFLIVQTAGADRKLPLPACLVIFPAVPLYSFMRRIYGRISPPLSKPLP